MNEKIRELMVEAGMLYTLSKPTHITEDGTHTFNQLYVYDKFDPEKFAELVVKECADYANWYQANSRYTDIAKAIKEHFGVEE